MRGKHRNTGAYQFIFVDLISAALRCRFHQTADMNACLDGVVAGNQTHVAAADDEKILTRAYKIAVNQRLERASAVDAG